MIRGGVRTVGELSCLEIWIGGRWCSVELFVAILPRKVESRWKRELKSVAKEVGERLDVVGWEAREVLGDIFTLAECMGVKKVKGNEGYWRKEVGNERKWREIREKVKGQGKEVVDENSLDEDKELEIGEGNWKFDEDRYLGSAGGLPWSQFTEEGWTQEIFHVEMFDLKRGYSGLA